MPSSSSAWRMWIEICLNFWNCWNICVILRMEDVDWNYFLHIFIFWRSGHPPHGGCGLKSFSASMKLSSASVILRMEDVDWNREASERRLWKDLSSSAWRMWIEITNLFICKGATTSSSAWRMWIEICSCLIFISRISVILRMEDVDWNSVNRHVSKCSTSHPPHGGCGLK